MRLITVFAPIDRSASRVLFFFQAEDGIRDHCVTGVQTCALPISAHGAQSAFDLRAGRSRRAARGRDRRVRRRGSARRLGGGLGRARHPRRRLRRDPRRGVRRLQALPERLLTRVGILGAPRPIPQQRLLAPLAGAVVIALALPLFIVAGWPLTGWAVAAVLWVGVQALGLLFARVKPSPDNVAASGALAFGMMFRLLAVLAVLLALAVSDSDAGLAAALSYGAAYTAELALSLLGYYGQEPRA